jgi:hypothetical protein
MESFSFKKKESPTHLQKIEEFTQGSISDKKPILSFNLISCLEDIDKEIEKKHNLKLDHKDDYLDHNRYKHIKFPKKVSKYE